MVWLTMAGRSLSFSWYSSATPLPLALRVMPVLCSLWLQVPLLLCNSLFWKSLSLYMSDIFLSRFLVTSIPPLRLLLLLYDPESDLSLASAEKILILRCELLWLPLLPYFFAIKCCLPLGIS